MSKRKLRHKAKKLLPINPIYFLVISLIFTGIAVLSLRNNNLTAIKLRDEVLKVDKQNGDTETALRNLREFVYGHMNTGLSSGASSIQQPVQLKYRYERLVQAEKDRVSQLNSKIYSEAQAVCEQQFPAGLSGSGRIPCIQSYVSSHGVIEQPIPDNLYKFDFVAPFWSPDLAGWSLLLAAVFFAVFVLRLGLNYWLKAELEE